MGQEAAGQYVAGVRKDSKGNMIFEKPTDEEVEATTNAFGRF